MPKHIDITGQKFGNLTVLKRHPELKKRGRSLYECRCDCGTIIFSLPDALKAGLTKTCGHCLAHMNIGKKYGKLTILKYLGAKNRLTWVLCQCDCGKIIERKCTYLIRGHIQSCGCLRDQVNETKTNVKIGNFYFKLKALKYVGKDENGNRLILCKCKCGNKKIISTSDFGIIKSCGCLQKESIPRGENKHNAKLKNFEADAIRELFFSNSGYSKKDLANMFNIDIGAIRRILRNETYKNHKK